MSETNITIEGKTYTLDEARRLYYELRKIFAVQHNIFEYYPPRETPAVEHLVRYPHYVTCSTGSWV